MPESAAAVHLPVMTEEILTAIPENCQITLDLTLGLGGHAREILAGGKTEFYCGIDRDAQALALARQNLTPYRERIRCIRSDFCQAAQELTREGFTADFILADLGVSSLQLDQAERGFSFRVNGPLDMRMDQSRGVDAAGLIADADERRLADIFWRYGEERFARRIARAIVRDREREPIVDTARLKAIVVSAIPARFRGQAKHPATKTFQALRLAVNDEPGQLEETLPHLPGLLNVGGRLAIISFHSLEDRPVKRFFKREAKGCVCPAEFPLCRCDNTPAMTLITRKALQPSPGEWERNPRSRSARLRIGEKL